MGFKTSIALAAVPVLFAIAPAHAGSFVFEDTNLNGNKRAGNFDHIKATFDTDTEEFSWSSTFSRNTSNGNLADGAWLVVSGGANPKNHVDEYAIFYMDGDKGQVSIYNYDGVNSANSYQHETFLGTTALNVTNVNSDTRTFDFSLDATAINSMQSTFGPDWKGISFEENIGLWFHSIDNPTITYNNNDIEQGIASFIYQAQGWHDSKNNATKKVPEPGSVAAIGIFAAAAATKLRKRLG